MARQTLSPWLNDKRIRWYEWYGSRLIDRGARMTDRAWRLRAMRGNARDVEMQASLHACWAAAIEEITDDSA